MRIGAIYSGISYQHAVLNRNEYAQKIEMLPVCDLSKIELSRYAILIFPRGTDQEIVYAEREKIKKFLQYKGIVVSFGEVTKEWLPGCRWGGVKPEDDGPLLIKKNHPVLKGLRPDDLHWHKGATGWCCHGHFVAPAGAEILVTNMLGDPIMYIDRQSTKGVILAASQLDAICHSFHGLKGAKILLDNIVRWAQDEACKIRR
ncbi:MAG: hypothetical protein J7J33_00835 [Caldisericia bacterium]|nr:hypothetical protein [Caldisericia bacterium]